MDNHPVLHLLGSKEDPPFRLLQATSTAIAKCPLYLSDLMQSDLQDDFIGLLTIRANRFVEVLKLLSKELYDQKQVSTEILSFIQQLAISAEPLLDRSQYLDLLYAALPLCSTNHSRWKLIATMSACSQTLELLTASEEGHSILLKWVLTTHQDGVDVSGSENWTQKLVTLVESCPDNHGLSFALARWQKVESLKQVLRNVLESGGETGSLKSSKAESYNSRSNRINIDWDTLQLLSEFGLPEPRSSRMCISHLDVLCCCETLLILEEILKTFPCRLCQEFLKHGVAIPQFRNNIADIEGGLEIPHEEIFSHSKGIGDWQVVLSSRAYRNLQNIKEDRRTISTLQAKLTGLADGGARSDTLRFRSEAPRIPLRVMKCSSNAHLLWQVDIAPGPEANMEQQVIKIWTVGSEKAFETMLDDIKRFQKGLSETRVARSLEVGPLLRGKRWPQVYEQSGNTRDLRPQTALDIRLINQEFIDTFNKSFTLTQDVLHSIIQRDLTAEYPFDLSQIEMRIIQHFKTPTLILGRSGTGKTTCLIFKMIAKYVASYKASPQQPARQVLLTCSGNLAEKLRTYTRRLVTTLSKKAAVPDVSAMSGRMDHRTLCGLDHNDFPLVCTWELFLTLLDRTISHLDRKDFYSKSPSELVDFKAFRHKYWPHFPPDVTRGLPPQLVFSEIMGVIKGSNYTCDNLEFLQARHYEGLSVRVAPNVTSREARTRVFRMFEVYEKLKQQAGNLDFVDWVVCLLRKLRNNPNFRSYLASRIDEFYVDEVQDLRCVDIALLLTLGNDPRAFHFGGDTAQGISQDAVFRFQDAKALFHQCFRGWVSSSGQKAMAQPQMFTLDRNYRSHQGILSLASTVMDLLWRSFPNTVDKLEPEVGTLIGPAPILFQKCDASTLTRCGTEASPDHELLFGAEQVIITRDETGKADLAEMIGHTALILTILQAKGMEFDDVILWNFLSTTPDAVGWRSLRNSMCEGSSRFDTVKHAGLCSELKHLYVAITRARVRFLVLESSEEASQPFIRMMNKTSSSKVLEVTSPACDDFSDKIKALEPRRSDDPHRWCANGEDMMARALYKEACLCFRRAGQPLKESRATAYLQEVEGEELAAIGETLGSRNKFAESAKTFQELNSIPDATRVLIRLDRLEDAAELWYTNGEFEHAAALFEKALNYERASESWHSHRDYNKAVVCLQNGALFDRLVIYLDSNKALLTEREILRHRPAIKHLLNKRKIQDGYRKAAIGLLGSVADQEKFYVDYDMTDSLVDLYREQHETTKLLNTLIKLDRLEEALNLTSSLPFQNDIIEKKKMSQLQAIVWVDRISTGPCRSSKILVQEENLGNWEHAFHILRVWDQGSCAKNIMSMEGGSIVKAFLCFYAAVNAEAFKPASKYDELPLDLLSQTVRLLKGPQAEVHGPVGEAVLLLCGVHYGFDSRQHPTMRTWSPLLKCQQLPQDENSVYKAALRWTIDHVSQAVMQVHELARDLFHKKWPTRCNNFLALGRCNTRNQGCGCSYLHGPVTSSSYTEFLEDLLKVNRMVCELTALYHQRTMSEQVSKNFSGARRYWLEKLFAALTFISGFEQDSTVLNEITRRIRTEEAMRVVASCLEGHLLYRARNEWGLQVGLGYVLEQLDSATHLGENVRCGLIRRTRQQLRFQHPYATMLLLEQLRSHITSGNAAQYLNALKAFTDGPSGIMTLDWYHFEAFHCHMSIFEGIALYLLLQVSQTSIVVPHSWLDLHLSDILGRNNLTNTSNSDQRIASRDALVSLLGSITGLLRWLEGPQHLSKKFIVCGRPYQRILLQSRTWQLPAIILCNLYSLFPQNITRNPWQGTVRAFELELVNSRWLDYTAGNLTELRSKLVASHTRYHAKNPLVIVNVTDAHTHPFTAFQKSHVLQSKKLSELRTRLAPAKPQNNPPTSDDDQLAKEEKAATCILKHFQKLLPRLKARKASANTERGRIIVNFHVLAKGAGLRIRSSLFRLGVACLSQLGPLGSSILALKKRALDTLEKAGFQDTEALDMVLGGVSELEQGLTRHHTRLSDEVLGSLVRAKDETGLEEMLQGQLELLEEDSKVVAELEQSLNGVAKDGA